eukprot:CAMPEP_0174334162 /NCGR_PEP_ID=MMETSP0810-20121108/19714_1 /TAXON_ID=73025 ORGANISM="Eutreptiella gymnastica-like, Strain CCMP1594" /NCGR_SAMPLE_ID=MMETSP0810 /ASSEMBLY_ACC=CAM_ASM_000659 /LENGTH=58 /DNA_ID=CAMNT_0015451679 /DNA_START=408 /DNA_END=584 /DNA_ORIENTATION=-
MTARHHKRQSATWHRVTPVCMKILGHLALAAVCVIAPECGVHGEAYVAAAGSMESGTK